MGARSARADAHWDLGALSNAQREQARRALEALQRPLSRWIDLPDDLVLLREISDTEVRRAERELAQGLALHRTGLEAVLREAPADARIGSASTVVLRAEHDAFEGSVAELHALIALVRTNGHDGNRQALGQYWRLVWEALGRHLRDEESWLGPWS